MVEVGAVVDPLLDGTQAVVDDVDSYAGNEVAINWNASLVFLVARLN